MKFNGGALRSLIGLTLIKHANSQCVVGGFDLTFEGYCNYESILGKFEEFFANPVNIVDGCTSTAEQELQLLLGGGDLDAKVKSICKESVDNFPSMEFDDIARLGPDFIREYYNGNTIWNEEHQTDYPLDDNGNPTNLLRSENNVYGDAGRVQNVYDGEAQYGVLDWPGHLTNFELDKCTTNAAMCCWPSDRQANDNNGNCAEEYDANCEDSDPSDNTDLCYVDLEKGHLSTGFEGSGIMTFEGDDGNNQHTAEGPIHCHGFAWANDESDFTSSYKANNLFYVSMYDHMTQRGYVRNIQGAPMCGCMEQMPVASRSDCTQVDVEEQYQITYDGTQWSGKLLKVFIDFNACNGFDRDGKDDNNDLWSYMNRLYREGKVTLDQLLEIGKYLVGDDPNMCNQAINDVQLENGLDRGHNEDKDLWVAVAGKDSLAIDPPLGPLSFDAVFADAPHGIILRRCVYCKSYHRKIYYKRLTPVGEGFNHYNYLINNVRKKDEDNFVYGKDFELYSTYEDAVAGINEWNCQNYKYDEYFPGGCKPDGTHQNNVGGSIFPPQGRSDLAWYVEKPSGTSSGIQDLETTTLGFAYFGGAARLIDGKYYISGFGSNVGGEGETFYQSQTHSDVSMSVDIEEFSNLSGWAHAGLMIRVNNDPFERFVLLAITPGNGVRMLWRSNYGYGGLADKRLAYDGVAVTIKLEKTVNTFKGYYLKEPDPLGTNIALGKSTSQSSEDWGGKASRGVDGNTDAHWHSSYSITHTKYEYGAWWKVNLDEKHQIHTVRLFNRLDCCSDRLQHFSVQLLDSDGNIVDYKSHGSGIQSVFTFVFENVEASQVRVIFKDTYAAPLSLAEVQVFAEDDGEEAEPNWVLVEEVDVDMPEAINAGMFVLSRTDKQPAEAIFSGYTEQQYTYPSASPSLSLAPTVVLPSRDVGNFDVAGSSSVTSDGRYYLEGSGDIQGRDDGFHFMNTLRKNDDFTITAYISNFAYTWEWSKAGIMARTFLCNESQMVMMGLFGKHGFFMGWRQGLDYHAEFAGYDEYSNIKSGWVKIEKVGDEYSGFYKREEEDGWTHVKTVTIFASKEPEMHVGLAVSSRRDQGQLASATFSDYLIEETTRSPTLSPVPTSTPPDINMYPNTFSECPAGSKIAQDDCWEALNFIVDTNPDIFQYKSRQTSSLNVHDWSFTPCGCFVWMDANSYWLDFDTSSNNCQVQSMGYPVCSTPPPTRALRAS